MPGNDLPHVLEEHEEMHRVRRGGEEIEFQVKAPRFIALRMHRKSTYAGNIGRLERAQHRILQQCLTHSLTLPVMIYREARKQHEGSRMACQPF
jgi:hypothetical protein